MCRRPITVICSVFKDHQISVNVSVNNIPVFSTGGKYYTCYVKQLKLK